MTPVEQATHALYVLAGVVILVAAIAGHIPAGVAAVILGLAHGIPLGVYGVAYAFGTWPQ